MTRQVADVSKPLDDLDVAHHRAIQLGAVDRRIPTVMLANVIGAVGITILMHHQHGRVLFPWCATVIVMSGLRSIKARRAIRRPGTTANGGAIRRRIIQSAIIALLSAGVPAWLLTQTSGLTFTTLLSHLVGSFWGGSMVLATVFPAAITFVSVIAVMIAGAVVSQGFDVEHVGLAAIVCLSAAFALRSTREQSKLFMAAERQKVDLEKQSEVIGILLKDYEEQTSDWLWEIDETLCIRNPCPRFIQALARPFEDVDGAQFDVFLSDTATPGNSEGLSELLAHGKARRSYRDVVIPVKVGEDVRWWSLSGRPMADEQGRFIGYRGVSTDITATRIAPAAHRAPRETRCPHQLAKPILVL